MRSGIPIVAQASHVLRGRRVLVAWLLALAGSAAGAEDGFAGGVRPLLDRHCVSCHGAERQKGKLRLDGAPGDLRDAAVRATWEKVHAALVGGDMPPAEKPRPSTDELDRLTSWIRGAVERGVADERGGPGRATMRRLTRAEYVRMLEDALGLRFANVSIDLAGKLPGDPHAEAFINDGDLLSFQTAHLKTYIGVCERALQHVLAEGPRPAGAAT